MIQRYDVTSRSAIPQILELLPPDAEPVGLGDYLNLSQVKLKLQQTILKRKLRSARYAVENYTGRALVTRKVAQIVDYDPKNNPTGIPLYMTSAVGEINLRLPPVRQITQVIVYDPFRQPTVVDPSVYLPLFIVDPETKLIVTLGHVWPGILSDIQSIRIECICGYTTLITAVDASANTLTAPGHPYQNGDVFRLTLSYGDSQTTTPTPPDGLVAYKNYLVANVTGDTFKLTDLAANPIDITSVGAGVFYAGEIPEPLCEAVMETATANLFTSEYDETKDSGTSHIPAGTLKKIRSYKKTWI